MAHIHIPRALAAIITGLPMHLEVEGASVAEVIAALDARWPGVAMRVCATPTTIREHINVFVDGERATTAMAVRPHSVVRIITAVSGG